MLSAAVRCPRPCPVVRAVRPRLINWLACPCVTLSPPPEYHMSLFDRLTRSLTRILLPAETPIADYPFVASDVALYQRTAHADASVLDAQTWDDMLLPQYSAQLARATSIFGQQELHRRLHADGGTVAASAVRV